MRISDFDFPEDRKYLIGSTPTHLWLKPMSQNDQCRIGLTDFFQKRIGEIFEITLREKGKDLDQGSTMGLVKAKNYSAILKSPLRATVIDVNNGLSRTPKLVNSAPYADGWLYILEIGDQTALQTKNFVPATDPALKDFLEKEIRDNALMSSDCCPDFMKQSGIARRKPKKP